MSYFPEVKIFDGAGNPRAANVNADNQLSVSVDNAKFSDGTTVAPNSVLLFGGKSDDGTPEYHALPLNAGGAALKVAVQNTITATISGSVAVTQGGAFSVTANAGTNLNTSALALEAGGNLAAAATSLAIMDDWDESDRAKVNLIAGVAGVDGNAGNVSNATQRVVLATNVALPAGTNAIGKLSANSGVDIGDVDVTSVVPGVTATSLGKADDAGHTSADVGVFMLTVRNSAFATPSNADRDYQELSTDLTGAAHTNPGGPFPTFGQKVTSGTTPEQVENTSTTIRKLVIKALPTNTGTVYVGPSGVSSSTGFPLLPGEPVEYWGEWNLNTWYIVTPIAGDGVAYSRHA